VISGAAGPIYGTHVTVDCAVPAAGCAQEGSASAVTRPARARPHVKDYDRAREAVRRNAGRAPTWKVDQMGSHQQPIRVLLADDHAVVRQGIRQFLEASGEIEVVAEAGDGEVALRLIREHLPDVAVLDIQMPLRSGIELARAIRADRLPVGVLILTAFDDEPYVRAVLQAGANGYVLKTADAEDIVEAVRTVRDGKSVLDPAIARLVISRFSSEPQLPIDRLTERELEVLRLVAHGYTNKAIGVQLSISDRTVQGHLAKVFGKLHAASRTEAVMRAVTQGLIPPVLETDDFS
jgi:DNA-binding NarL/FixJ family response regulator